MEWVLVMKETKLRRRISKEIHKGEQRKRERERRIFQLCLYRKQHNFRKIEVIVTQRRFKGEQGNIDKRERETGKRIFDIYLYRKGYNCKIRICIHIVKACEEIKIKDRRIFKIYREEEGEGHNFI